MLAAYDLLRGHADGCIFSAWYRPQLEVDAFLFGGTVPTVWLQDKLWHGSSDLRWYDYASWTVYVSYFVATYALAGVLWFFARERFRRYVGCVALLAAMGFATFALFPAAPPWLASRRGELEWTTRLIGPISGHVPFFNFSFEGLWARGSEYANPVAAVPSLHAAYTLLITLFLWRWAPRWGRSLLALYPLAMAFALVYTAEHYVFDILLGWTYTLIAVWVVARVAHVFDADPPTRCCRRRELFQAPGPNDIVVQHLQHRGRGYGHERSRDPEQRAPDEHRDEDDERMNVELIALDDGRDHIALQVLDQDGRRKGDPKGGKTLERGDREQRDPGQPGPSARYGFAQRDDDCEGKRERDADQEEGAVHERADDHHHDQLRAEVVADPRPHRHQHLARLRPVPGMDELENRPEDALSVRDEQGRDHEHAQQVEEEREESRRELERPGSRSLPDRLPEPRHAFVEGADRGKPVVQLSVSVSNALVPFGIARCRLPEVGDLREEGRGDEPDETYDHRQRGEIDERHCDRPWYAKLLEALCGPGEGGSEENADEQDQQHVREPRQGEQSDKRKKREQERDVDRQRAPQQRSMLVGRCGHRGHFSYPSIRCIKHESTRLAC